MSADNTAHISDPINEEQSPASTASVGAKPAALRTLLLLAATTVAICCAVSFKVADAKFLRSFTGFVAVEWTDLSSCAATETESVGFQNLKRLATWFPGKPAAVATCSSDWFAPKGNYIELEYAANKPIGSPHKLYIAIERESSGEIARLLPAEGKRYGTWRLMGHFFHDLEESRAAESAERIRLHLIDHDPGAGWLSLRKRVNFYNVPQWSVTLRRWAGKRVQVVQWAFAASLTAALWLALPLVRGYFTAALISAALAFVVHYRFDLFFYGDDLLFFERFAENGWRGLFISHHEHFIPLFAGFFYLEHLLLEGSYFGYQLVTFGLFALNSALLYLFLIRVGATNRGAALLSCGLFVCCALQTAALQWVTCQSTLLSVTFRLLAYLLTLTLLEQSPNGQSRIWNLLALLGCVIAAPFCFGGGVTLWAEVLLLAILFRSKDSRLFRPIVATTLSAAALVAGAYLLNRQGIGQTRDQMELPYWEALLRYTLFGSQFGTLLRSFGFYQLLFYIPNTKFIYKDLVITLLSTGFSAAVLGYYLYLRNGGWRHWLLGQLVLISPFLLTGIGRYDWGGVEYSLSLRYHAVSMIGVCLMLAPLFIASERNKFSGKASKLAAIVLPILFVVWMNKQLELARYSRFYTDRGQLDRSYAQQVVAWNKTLDRTPGQGSYEGVGTEYLGLYPIPYGGSRHDPIAYNWQRHPDSLYRLLVSRPN